MAKTAKAPRMLTHEHIWTGLARLAGRAGLPPSGLAKRSGLDPTTFNKSKRVTADGRERWPSTESVSKALAATNSSIDTFVQLIGDTARTVQSVPLLGFAQAGAGGYFDDGGFPAGQGWDDEVGLPSVNDEHAYALEISFDQMKPTYRNSRADKVRSPSIQPVLLLYLDIQAMEASMKLLRIELALLIGILVAASILISSMAQAGVAPP